MQGSRRYPRVHLHRSVVNGCPGGYTYFLTQNAPWNVDYVFDGRNPPYKPGSEANPLQEYGVTKFAGETAVLGVSGAKVVVLRVPVL